MKRRERPIKRTNPSGKDRWVARYTNRQGNRRSAGTFDLQRDAQDAIDGAYKAEARGTGETVGAYSETWTDRHPRSERTNKVNADRVRYVLDLEVDGRRLRDWPYRDLRRKHALELVGLMLTEQGRAVGGAKGIIRTLSAMTEDAITDELADVNAFKGVRVRKNDPRATKAAREPRVFTFAEMHAFARAARKVRALVPVKDEPGVKRPRPKAPARNYEAMVRTLADCNLRLGELLGLERDDYDPEVLILHVRGNAHEGVFTPGDTDTKKHVRDVPVPPGCARVLDALPPRIDTTLLFPTPTGKMWRERNFRRDVWEPAIDQSGMDCAPHDFRHSYVTHLRAQGIDWADLSDVTAHSVETQTTHYTHPLRQSHDAIRKAIG